MLSTADSGPNINGTIFDPHDPQTIAGQQNFCMCKDKALLIFVTS